MNIFQLAGITVLLFLGLLVSNTGNAHQLYPPEPQYCSVKNFLQRERPNNIPHLIRVHVFQLGDLTLAGLAIGSSDVRYVESLADQYGKYQAYEKSCTWYLNNGDDEASKLFNHRYVSNPIFQSEKVADEYESVLASSFDKDPANFVSCAIDHKYLAMGCDGQRHRGPSVFAMFLAYSGCTPEHSVAIANKIWGSNLVSTSVRVAIAKKGFDLGNQHPESRAKLRKIMEGGK